MDKIPVTFQAQITQHSPIDNNTGFTLCRARVFYTGLNRNGSYISKEFAENFINTASGCPIVGLWDYEKHDFTDHRDSDRKRAYGFIPEEPHFAWEEVNDYDGKTRNYATFDVVLWTKAFQEANEVITHPLSMEIDPDSISGSFMVMEGEYCFYFYTAQMLGVCVLGYDVEPCFEGAEFIGVEKAKEFKRLFQIDKEQALLTYNNKGDTSMEEEKELTPVEEFTVVRDDDIEEPTSEPVAETNPDFSAEEPAPESKEEKEEEIDFSAEKEKFLRNIAELEERNKEFENKIQELENKVTELEEANFTLNEYKENKIKEEKQEIINNYSNILSDEDLKAINIDEFSCEDLDDKLAAMAYRKGVHEPANFQLIYTNVDNKEDSNDISDIMKKYKD